MRKLAYLLILVAAPAAADDAPQPVHVTTFLLQHPGIDDQLLVPIMAAIDEGLKRNPRLEMKGLDMRLAEFAQEIPQDQIDQGKADYDDGMKAFAALDLATALKKLTSAVDTYTKVLPYIKKQQLADAMMALGATEFEQGEKKQARTTFVRLLTWRPDYKVDVNKFPPQLLAPFESARKEVEREKRGSLDIRSEPPSAQAYVDGRYVGVTPTFAEGLTVGEHFITFKKEGFKKAVMPATVSPRFQQAVNVPLERSGKFLLVQQALDSVEKVLGNPVLGDSSDNLKEVLFIDHAVFVRARPGAAGMVDLDIYLYDLRTKKKLSEVTKSIPVGPTAEKESEPLASNLYANVSYEVQEEAPKDAPLPQQQERKKFWKTWWFWTATGVVVAGAIVVGVAVAETRPKSCAAGSRCFEFTF